MIKTYTYKLKPNKKVERKFGQWLGVCRVVYNLSKEVSETSYNKGKSLSQYEVQNQIPELKKYFPWINEVHSQTIQLASALYFTSMKNFFKGAGYPKWASKRNWKSVPFSQGIKTTHNAFKLPKFGVVKVFNFSVPNGKIKGARLIQESDGIYLKIVVEKEQKIDERPFAEIGIDMGLKYFLTSSEGDFVNNPKHLFSKLSELRIENRKLSRMKKGGANYKKQVVVLQRLYQKVKRTRLDFLHKESTKLASKYTTVYVENLNIKGMSKNGKLSKHILDCGWGTFFLLLEYKTNVVNVIPAYTSQMCNSGGHTAKENRKSQSIFECISCGHTDNADLNAANNIKEKGQFLVEAKVSQ
jgi:putative transposase